MAKPHQPKRHRTRRAALAGVAAAGVSGALILGTTTGATVDFEVNLAANTAVGVGGRDDPLAARVQTKLSGDYVPGYPVDDYEPVEYPANLEFQSSIDVGIPALKDRITAVRSADPNGTIRVVSFSEGTLVAEQVKRDYAEAGYPQDPATFDFEFIASPYSPNGGIFARFPGLQIPGLLPVFSAAQPTRYDSTFVTYEYDGFADFPAYFNPFSVVNALAGMVYAHPDPNYDDLDLTDPNTVTITKKVDNGAGGEDTYIFVVNPHLPLLAPIRQVAAMAGLTPLTEPVLGAVEPLLRVAVDAGYTDRNNETPDRATPFSFITPPAKIAATVGQVPDALQDGVGNATGQTPSTGTASARDLAPVPAGRSRTALSQDDAVDPSGQTPSAPKPATTKKDPFSTVSSAIRKGLQATLKPVGSQLPSTTGTAEVGTGEQPDAAPQSAPDAA